MEATEGCNVVQATTLVQVMMMVQAMMPMPVMTPPKGCPKQSNCCYGDKEWFDLEAGEACPWRRGGLGNFDPVGKLMCN